MIIGVPTEVKTDEYRVAMLPVGVEELVARGHQCDSGGRRSGERASRSRLLESRRGDGGRAADEVFEQVRSDCQSKEPQPREYPLIRPGQLLFTYFHFAASRRADRGDDGIRSDLSCLRNVA